MRDQFHSIRSSFGRMILEIRNILLSNSPSFDDLQQHLKACYPDLRPQLAHAHNINKLLDLIEKECTLIDIEPIKNVINKYGIHTKVEKYLQEYNAVMEEFCRSISLQLCLEERFDVVQKAHPPLRCETATYVFDWEPEECMLNDIKRILDKASGRLVKIRNINTGHSTSITCSFPYSRLETVITESSVNLEMLKKNGLIELIVGYTIIWKRSIEKVNNVMKLIMCDYWYIE